jgi:hypothetical protein
MKIALYVVALLVAGGAAYFSFELLQKLEEQREIRITTVSTNQQVTANAEATEAELTAEQEALKLALQDKSNAEAAIAALRSNQVQLKRELAEFDGQLEAQQVDFDHLERTIEEITKLLAGISGELGEPITLENLAEKVAEIEDKRKTQRAALQDLEKLVAAAETKLASNIAESGRLTDRRVERSARIARNAMEAVVTAVDQDWGFVVIGAGANSGFTPQTSLLVRRDGRLIGRVRPSAIEATQTIADIVPDSLSRGVRIQPGDRVILARPEN